MHLACLNLQAKRRMARRQSLNPLAAFVMTAQQAHSPSSAPPTPGRDQHKLVAVAEVEVDVDIDADN